MSRMPIYLYHHATTPVDPRVLEAMLPYLSEHFGNPSSGHPVGWEAATAVARARFKDEHWIVEDIRETRFTDTAIELRVVGQAVWAQLIDPRLAAQPRRWFRPALAVGPGDRALIL